MKLPTESHSRLTHCHTWRRDTQARGVTYHLFPMTNRDKSIATSYNIYSTHLSVIVVLQVPLCDTHVWGTYKSTERQLTPRKAPVHKGAEGGTVIKRSHRRGHDQSKAPCQGSRTTKD